jgi:hypothetical protein
MVFQSTMQMQMQMLYVLLGLYHDVCSSRARMLLFAYLYYKKKGPKAFSHRVLADYATLALPVLDLFARMLEFSASSKMPLFLLYRSRSDPDSLQSLMLLFVRKTHVP